MASVDGALATGGPPLLITDPAIGAVMTSGLLPVAALGLIELPALPSGLPAGALPGPLP